MIGIFLYFYAFNMVGAIPKIKQNIVNNEASEIESKSFLKTIGQLSQRNRKEASIPVHFGTKLIRKGETIVKNVDEDQSRAAAAAAAEAAAAAQRKRAQIHETNLYFYVGVTMFAYCFLIIAYSIAANWAGEKGVFHCEKLRKWSSPCNYYLIENNEGDSDSEDSDEEKGGPQPAPGEEE